MSPEHLAAIKNEISEAKYPVDFVRIGFSLTKEQALKATNRTALDWDFDQIFERDGHVDIGSLIMIHAGGSWSDAKNYFNRTTGRAGELNRRRQPLYNREEVVRPNVEIQSQSSGAPVSNPNPINEIPDLLPHHISRADSFIRSWTPGGSSRNSNITITNRRLRAMQMNWTDAQVTYFMRTAPLTTSGKNRIKKMLDDRRA